jgi:hypothetical protein
VHVNIIAATGTPILCRHRKSIGNWMVEPSTSHSCFTCVNKSNAGLISATWALVSRHPTGITDATRKTWSVFKLPTRLRLLLAGLVPGYLLLTTFSALILSTTCCDCRRRESDFKSSFNSFQLNLFVGFDNSWVSVISWIVHPGLVDIGLIFE